MRLNGRRIFVFYSLILLVFSYLAFKGLGDNYLFDDESQTGIVGRNVLKCGYVSGWDGRNLWTYVNGGEINSDFICSYDSPLQYYLAALSFTVFGSSAFSTRFPFVLVGLLSLIIFLFVLKEEFNDNEFSVVALSLLAFSWSFLLNIRQALYYSLAIFFSLWVFYYFKKYIRTGRTLFLAYMTIGSIGFFYSTSLLCVTFLMALALLYFLFYFKKENFPKILIALSLFLVFTAPYIIYARHYVNAGFLIRPSGVPWIYDRLVLLIMYLRDFHKWECFPWIVSLGLVYFLVKPGKQDQLIKTGREWALLVLAYIFFITIFSPQNSYGRLSESAWVRYLNIVLSFSAGLTAVFLFLIKRKSKIIFSFVMLLLVFSNLLAINPFNPKIRFNLVNYIHEIENPYTSAYEEVVGFLEKHAKQDDLVYCNPGYMNYPVMYYLGGKVKICGQLNRQTSLPKQKVKSLGSQFFLEEVTPDWIIIFGKNNLLFDVVKYFSKKAPYEQYAIIQSYWRDMWRPELFFHSFGPVEDFDMDNEGVYVYRKVKKATGRHGEATRKYYPVNLGSNILTLDKNNRHIDIPVPEDRLANGMKIESAMGSSTFVPDNTIMARVKVFYSGGAFDYDIVAGADTSEWAFDRPDVRKQIKHRRAKIAYLKRQRYSQYSFYHEHRYYTDKIFNKPIKPTKIQVEYACDQTGQYDVSVGIYNISLF